MAQLILNPVAGSNSPADGYVRKEGVDVVFSTLITSTLGVGSNNDSATTNANVILLASATSNQFAELIKVGFNFDTSALTSGATINSAVLSVYISAKANGLGSDSYGVVQFTPPGTNSIGFSEWSQFGSTIQSDAISYASITTSAFNDFTLTAGGIALINKTGITSLGLLSKWVIDNSFGGVWGSGLSSSITVNFADSANKPKLTIDYTPAPVTRNPSSLSMLGVG